MRKREYKVLKYVKRHPGVTKQRLYSKFPFLEDDFHYINDYFWIDDLEKDVCNGLETGTSHVVDTSTYRLKHKGYEEIEKKRHDKWLFWFPYAITTIIAATSAIFQALNFIMENFPKVAP